MLERRQTVREWYKENAEQWKELNYEGGARDQLSFYGRAVPEVFLSGLSLIPQAFKHLDLDLYIDCATVDGTHRSKSCLLPVYRYQVGPVSLRIRDNFHDVVIECNHEVELPLYMQGVIGRMAEEGPQWPSRWLCSNREFAVSLVWWLSGEALKHRHKDVRQHLLQGGHPQDESLTKEEE